MKATLILLEALYCFELCALHPCGTVAGLSVGRKDETRDKKQVTIK
jgi:hypothetical protein